MSVYSVDKLISEARKVAAEYKRATGKPLPGVTTEVCLHDAARFLDLELCQEQTAGYDAIGRGDRDGQKIQIKGRAIFDENKTGQRIGQLKLEQEWDSVVLVLLDDDLEAFEIFEASREDIEDAISDKAESSRRKRGVMSVAKFKIIGQLAWSRENGTENEVWDNQTDS